MTLRRSRVLSPLALIASYLAIRWGLDPYWREISQYYSYAYELIFSLVVGWCYRHELKFKIKWSQEFRVGFLPALLGGALIYKLITFSGITVPFDFQSFELIFLLLILAPVLEELLFRMALWETSQKVFKSAPVTLVMTTLFFSVGHLMALWHIPAPYKPFVLIQTLYVIFLGLGAGYRRIQSGTFLAGILVHFAFNLGFFLAALLR